MALYDLATRSFWTYSEYRRSRAKSEEIQRFQERGLRKLLRHSAANSTYYGERLRGFDVDQCRLQDLPVTNKSELMAHFDDVVTDPVVHRANLEQFLDEPTNVGRLFLDKYPVCHTSGSQGQPMLVVQNQLTLDLLFAFQMSRGYLNYGNGLNESIRRFFSPARIAVVISKPGFFPSAWIWQHLPASMRRFMRLLYLPSNDPQLSEKLNEFRPTVLVGNPTSLDLLTQKADRIDFRSLKQVVVNSESLKVPLRERLATTFRVPVLDTYACGECVFLTSGCPAGGSHINADWAILEVVDELYRPVPPGEFGHKVLLTNLANTVQPLIRYEIGDRVKMATTPCGCGNRLPRIEQIDGRTAEFFWVETDTGVRKLSPYPFQHAFEFLRNVREWQAIQQDRNRILVRLEPLPNAFVDLAFARMKLDERLQLAGFEQGLDIHLEIVRHLASDTRTGKFRRFVGLPTSPEGRIEAQQAPALKY